MLDTVKNAEATPTRELPYADLGLTEDEYVRIVALLDRRPTDSELAMYSIMWSEHASYKSSKVHPRQFCLLPTGDPFLLGLGVNAGFVAVA